MSIHRSFVSAFVLVLGSALLLAGCGHGHGDVYVDAVYPVIVGDAEVDNQTDLGGTFENLYVFEMTPSGTPFWTGNLLPDVIFPGEIVYVGSFEEDLYDAEAELDFGVVPFFDVFLEGGYTTTFEVF